jgi:hypothetical protein
VKSSVARWIGVRTYIHALMMRSNGFLISLSFFYFTWPSLG